MTTTASTRYGLFTLMGIAGEAISIRRTLGGAARQKRGKAGTVRDQGKLNGNDAAERPAAVGTLGAFAKNRKPWTPPKQALAPEASATLRARLLGELGSLTSAEDATGVHKAP